MDEVGEVELMERARQGGVIDCEAGRTRRWVSAALIRRCCLGLKDQVDPHGLRFRKAMVAGSLDLAGLDLPFPVRFDECDFDSALIVEGAQLAELALTRCPRLPGLLGNGLRIRRDLDLSGSRLSGAHATTASTSRRSAVWLCESEIGGRLLCVNTVIRADGERSIQADRIHVGGTVRLLHQFTAYGEIRMLGARVGGSFDLTGAHIEAAGDKALDLNDAVIGGSLFLITSPAGRRPVIRGRTDLSSARISGQVLIRDATLEEPGITPEGSGYSRSRAGGTALSAPRLSVGAEVTLDGACEVIGGADLSMSEVSSVSVGGDCSLRGGGHPALDLTNAELRSSLIIHSGATVEGTVRLRGARIRGDLSLQKATLSVRENTWVIAAHGVSVDGDVLLQGIQVTGGPVEFRGATLGSVFNAFQARLDNPRGFTLSLHHATVRGSVKLREIESAGVVVLDRAAVGGRLHCTGATFNCRAPTEFNRPGHALQAVSATFRGGMDLDWASVSPSADFTDASTTYLADDPKDWPERFHISGFSYERFRQSERGSARAWDHAARARWLDRQAGYDAGPYEQAARVFRQHGYSSEAEQILIARQRKASQAARARRTHPRRILDAVYGASVGYGYRPGRVLWLLATLLLLVTASLVSPAAQATLRATNPAGGVYTTSGPLPNPGGTMARVPASPRRPPSASAGSAASPASRQSPAPHGARPDSCGNGQVRCFNPVLYAIDTVVPLVSLGQRSTWYPDPNVPDGTFMQWWLNIATLLGWLLSSIFVLSLARLTRST